MMNARTVAICVIGFVAMAHGVEAQKFARYRNFELGSDLAAVSTLTGVAVSEAKVIHERPSRLQDLDWRPSRWSLGSTTPSTDAVEQIVFSFYNDQLFRLVIDYGRDRTEGMTDADLIEAISALYGAPIKRTAGTAVRVASRVEVESGAPLARWGDAENTVVLYRTHSYDAAMRLIVTNRPLDALARKAEAQAAKLAEREAPRREVARQKKEEDDGRAAAQKARATNKAAFRP